MGLRLRERTPDVEEIEGPREAHGVSDPESYMAMADAFGRQHGLFKGLVNASVLVPAYVTDGKWLIDCVNCWDGSDGREVSCKNQPSASPDWGIAICFECGIVYRPEFPAEREEIEKVLLKRKTKRSRNFLPHEGETVETLRKENIDHGEPG